MCRRVMPALIAGLLVAAWGVGAAAPAGADNPGSKPPLPEFTPERESVVLEFVEAHHPELAGVLAGLNKAKPSEYRQAICELFQTCEKLETVRKRDDERYRLMLETWKITSRAELLAARISCLDKPDPELEAQLRALIEAQLDSQIAQVELTRRQLLESLKSAEANIATLKKDRQDIAERRYRHLTAARKSGPGGSARPSAPPGDAGPPTKPTTPDRDSGDDR